MHKETQRDVSTAIHGLMYAADLIDQALLGEKRSLPARESEREGPFATKLYSMADIADGGLIPDAEAARNDLLFLFGLLHHLQGGFHSALWEILSRAHVVLAEMITEQEAKAMLADQAYWLSLDARLGHVHPLVKTNDGEPFRTWDATYLGYPSSGEIRYARHEIEARKRLYDKLYGDRHLQQADKPR